MAFSRIVEASLACHRCCRADRTIVLSDSVAAEHFDKAVNHPFDGRVVTFTSERVADSDDTELVTARYRLSYEFQSFVDAKYPERLVSPQPAWGRIHFTIDCTCGRAAETFTQTNLVRPRRVRCECGRILLVEHEQGVLFSEALPAPDCGG